MLFTGLYKGLKNAGIMFLMADTQLPNEYTLTSGEAPDLFADDTENISSGVCNEAGKNVKS